MCVCVCVCVCVREREREIERGGQRGRESGGREREGEERERGKRDSGHMRVLESVVCGVFVKSYITQQPNAVSSSHVINFILFCNECTLSYMLRNKAGIPACVCPRCIGRRIA